MNLLIIGHGRHGKDTVAELMRIVMGLTFVSSSEAANEIVIYPALKDKYNYSNLSECFEDRVNHREEWRDLISTYNSPDKSKLARKILELNDCYVGMRCHLEYEATKHLFDHTIWVDAFKRKEADKSMSIRYDKSMIYVDNNHSKIHLLRRVADVAEQITNGKHNRNK